MYTNYFSVPMYTNYFSVPMYTNYFSVPMYNSLLFICHHERGCQSSD